ncbi:potassium transporter Kup [Halothiobacillus sp.]|uniref:potassium transporter Kup n=1 Tax=Halothiobacillus sp. TaxID=1891311 RepID=UPI002622D023|nr:potassium transporter Kup [Halothiobacillus sp.]
MGNHPNSKARLTGLSLAATGIVYGDIGTSPLYTLNTIFSSVQHPITLAEVHILGVLSLIFWSLIIVVSIKYVMFVMRADNQGEGGIMALMSLALQSIKDTPRLRNSIILLGIFGAALFYGDSVITPAISVLSAVEGLEIASTELKPFVIPVTLGILWALFLLQRKGTARVGSLFGPIMLVWFLVLGILGLLGILSEPRVLMALNPIHAVHLLTESPWAGFLSLGGVVLALTGAEALYADMGHFGRLPVQLAWFGLVLPALLLNYFGQGALLMLHPEDITNPFFRLAPEWSLYPLVALATTATVIASQAVISGTFSITRQAMLLGYIPRMNVLQTSDDIKGQIYIPVINWILMIVVFLLILGFESSSKLAAAYGIAVTGTMVITSILAFIVVRRLWNWSPLKAGIFITIFLGIDLAFFGANLIKLEEGGWFPLLFGLVLFILMTTWKRGRELLRDKLNQESIDLLSFVHSMSHGISTRVPGTAIFLTGNPKGVPHALLHNLKHNKILHQDVVILSIKFLDIPKVSWSDKLTYEALPNHFHRISISFGFNDETDIPESLTLLNKEYLELNKMQLSYFIGRETLIPGNDANMPLWRKKLFISMFRNSGSVVNYFSIPPNAVVELGAQIVL